MYLPIEDDETATYRGYVRQQFELLRAAAHGLNDEQVRATPCRSALSIGGILKHITSAFAWNLPAAQDPLAPADPAEAFQWNFRMRPDETLAELLTRFDLMVDHVDATMFAGDPDERVTLPSAPWLGITEPSNVRRRYQLVHVIEELARHVGHADIIREQLDGATAPDLLRATQA